MSPALGTRSPAPLGADMVRLVRGVAVSALALALYGLVRLAFNLFGLRAFGPEFIGRINTGLSAFTVAGFLAGAPTAGLIGKFVAESEARGQGDAGSRLFSRALLLTALALIPATLLAVFALPEARGERMLFLYAPGFGLYWALKSGCFAFRENRRYFLAELIGALAFTALFLPALWTGSRNLASASLLAAPWAFNVVAFVGLWRRTGWPLGRFAVDLDRRHWGFLGSSLLNALSGLGALHLVVLVAGLALPSTKTVGFLAVQLSALTPLNLLPNALGAVLFPELARRFGLDDRAGQCALVESGTLVLHGVSALLLVPTFVFPEIVFRLLALPVEPALVRAWIILGTAAFLWVVSAPCGYFLNAAADVHRHAWGCAAFLAGGVAAGGPAIVTFGLDGVGLMRMLTAGCPSWFRIILAHRRLGWIAHCPLAFILAHGSFLAAAAAGLTGQVQWAGPAGAAAVLINGAVLFVLLKRHPFWRSLVQK